MSKKQIYDVFLSHHAQDVGLVSMVAREMEAAGCGVFSLESTPVKLGGHIQSQVLDALVDSSAVVVLLTRASVESRWIAFEVGVAMAWDKPVFILHDGLDVRSIPEFLNQFHLAPLSDLSRVVKQIQSLRQPLSDSQRESLVEVYREVAIPVDQLLRDQKQRSKLSRLFAEQSPDPVPVNRLLQELIRLRKNGKLPKPRKLSEVIAAT